MARMTSRKLLDFLFSNKLTLTLLVAFAAAMGYATFLENDYGTPAARALIYEAWWFELMMLVLGLNFVGNIFRYRLLRREKLAILTFHLAFIVILFGAFITRYTGLEGLVRIREGQQSNVLISQKHYLQVRVHDENGNRYYEKPLHVSSLTPPEFAIDVGRESPIWVKSAQFVPDAEEVIADGLASDLVIKLATANDEGRLDHYLENKGQIKRGALRLTLNQPQEGAFNMSYREEKFWLEVPVNVEFMTMATQQVGTATPDSLVELKVRTLYQSQYGAFVVSEVHVGKQLGYRTTDDKEAAKVLPDVLSVNLEGATSNTSVVLKAREGLIGPDETIVFEGTQLDLNYGPKPLILPFSLQLDDFQLERYPGSTSPSSYASELTVLDGERSFPYRIFMNNVLDYGGYRFFQASYDLDERGTVLSVNRDWWGTRITYLGYFLMGLGMLLALFGKHSRFYQLNQQLKRLKAKPVAAVMAVVFCLYTSTAGASSDRGAENMGDTTGQQVDLAQLLPAQYVDASHAAAFGRLLVQDLDGRIKPINTLASEFLRKVSRKLKFKLNEGPEPMVMDCNQVFLSLHADPVAWQYVPLIKVDLKKGRDIFDKLEQQPRPFLAFQDFLDETGNYHLSHWVEVANRKKPAERSSLDQEILKVDERFNIVFQALSGQYLKIFPQPNDPANTWFSAQFQKAGFSREDSLFVKSIIPRYFHSVQQARTDANWQVPNEHLAYINTFQQVLGKEVSPSPGRVKAELLYNQLNLFYRLFPFFWGVGLLLLVVAIMTVFQGERKWLKRGRGLGNTLAIVGFVVLTANMILRWYAGGHAPWSNGYEMTILVTWALFFFSLIFINRSQFILPLACLFGGTLLFVAFLDWLNPEITNLVPVLKSYWLKIHVAIIVSSYAPLALSALLGFTGLWLMISKAFRNEARVEESIKELTYLNEMSMTIGVFLLAIGTFLGGVWANESWGRYWGWDPKETWALISIIVYAAVLHLRLVPALRSAYTFNFASVVAFSSIIMTSFGVNYYLAGLHSYAKGDPLPIPSFVYWVVAIVGMTAIAAYWVEKRKPAVD